MNKKILIVDDSFPVTEKFINSLNKLNDEYTIVLGSDYKKEQQGKEIEEIGLNINNKKLDLSSEPYYQKYNKKRRI